MNTVLPLLLFLLAGLLVGGTWSMYRQDARRGAVMLGVLAALALAGGIAWLWPEGS